MTVHKLTAGDGYTYLTRQVASMDERRTPGQSLADYHTARGNPPGVWMRSGAAALELTGTPVSEAQVKALFGDGCHPNRGAMLAVRADIPETKLGASYPQYQPLASRRDRVATAVEEFEQEKRPATDVAGAQADRGEEARHERRPVAGFRPGLHRSSPRPLLWTVRTGGTPARVRRRRGRAV